MKNCPTSNAANAGGAEIDLREQVQNLFQNCGDAAGINETLWDMFQGSISNPELPSDVHENAERAYLYKRLTEFFTAIEPVKPAAAANIFNDTNI